MTDIPRSSQSPEEHDGADEELDRLLDKLMDEVDDVVAESPDSVEYLGAEALRQLVPKPRQAA